MIEWTDVTWNPVRGCSRVSEGCRNCYAERQAARFSGSGQPFAGFAVRGRIAISTSNPENVGKKYTRWTGEVELIPSKLDEPLRWRKPRRVFVNSMSDLFHEALSDEAIAAVFGVMAACPQHTFQVLTKRPERMRQWFKWATSEEDGMGDSRIIGSAAYELGDGSAADIDRQCDRLRELSDCVASDLVWPLPNVWLGVSVENQETADARIPVLLETPAALRFVSYEPALEAVNFGPRLRRSSTHHVSMSVPGALRNRSFDGLCDDDGRELSCSEAEGKLRVLLSRGVEKIPSTNCDAFDEKAGCKGHPNPSLEWLIVGGESGPGARPCDLAWIRSVVEQCKVARVPVFVKQLGARPLFHPSPGTLGAAPCDGACCRVFDRKGGNPVEWPEDLRVREFPGGGK